MSPYQRADAEGQVSRTCAQDDHPIRCICPIRQMSRAAVKDGHLCPLPVPRRSSGKTVIMLHKDDEKNRLALLRCTTSELTGVNMRHTLPSHPVPARGIGGGGTGIGCGVLTYGATWSSLLCLGARPISDRAFS